MCGRPCAAEPTKGKVAKGLPSAKAGRGWRTGEPRVPAPCHRRRGLDERWLKP